MPRCPYCGTEPYKTYCQSYVAHLEQCHRRTEQMFLGQLGHTLPAPLQPLGMPPPIVIYNYGVIHMSGLGYPQSELSQRVLAEASRFDIKTLTTIEELDRIIGSVQDANEGEITRTLSGADKRAQAQALAFLAHVMKVIRGRLQRETPASTVLIEAAEDFEKGCLKDKQDLETSLEEGKDSVV